MYVYVHVHVLYMDIYVFIGRYVCTEQKQTLKLSCLPLYFFPFFFVFFVLRQGFFNEPRAHHLAMIVSRGSPGPLFSALSLCAEVPGTRYHTWFYVCTELSTEILMLVQRARSLLSHLSPQLVGFE